MKISQLWNTAFEDIWELQRTLFEIFTKAQKVATGHPKNAQILCFGLIWDCSLQSPCSTRFWRLRIILFIELVVFQLLPAQRGGKCWSYFTTLDIQISTVTTRFHQKIAQIRWWFFKNLNHMIISLRANFELYRRCIWEGKTLKNENWLKT